MRGFSLYHSLKIKTTCKIRTLKVNQKEYKIINLNKNKFGVLNLYLHLQYQSPKIRGTD